MIERKSACGCSTTGFRIGVGPFFAFGPERVSRPPDAPAVVAALLDLVDHLPQVLADFAGPQLAGLAVEAEPPHLPQAITAIFWADERAVPPDDPESNYGIARRLWLEPAGVPDAAVHRMHGEAPDLAAAAKAYSDVLEVLRGAPPRLDLVLLGVGPDGHVASLFPGHPLLAEESRWVAPVADAPKPPPRRLTLTLPVLAGADHVVIAATGAAKASCVRAALDEPDSSLPVALVARRARRVTFLLDPDAAGGRSPIAIP